MNILHINTLDTRGGAGKVATRLTEALRRRGHTAPLFVGYKHSSNQNVHTIPRNPLYYRLSKLFATDLRFSRSNTLLETEAYKKADLIHFHNIHSGFFNLETFVTISHEKPVVWTLQDLWPITAGCTDSYHCKEEKPRRVLGILWDNRPHLLAEKKEAYSRSRFTSITTSRWMAEKLQGSILEQTPTQTIYNGIDTRVFTPREKQAARMELGLPVNKKIILFIATHGAGDYLKGADYALQIAASYQNDPEKLFVTIGGTSETKPRLSRGNILETGYISDEQLLASYYAAADVFLYPSRADNSPLVIAESMACGTPTVSFAVDGITEMIDGCGLLAEPGNLEDLRRKTEELSGLSAAAYARMRNEGIKRVQERYSIERMTEDYLDLYARCIAQRYP